MTYRWVQSQCFVDYTVEIRTVCEVFCVEEGFPRLDLVDRIAKFDLNRRVFAKLVE